MLFYVKFQPTFSFHSEVTQYTKETMVVMQKRNPATQPSLAIIQVNVDSPCESITLFNYKYKSIINMHFAAIAVYLKGRWGRRLVGDEQEDGRKGIVVFLNNTFEIIFTFVSLKMSWTVHS